MVEIQGQVQPGFESVREAFQTNFEQHGEVGAGVCVYFDGQPVVELYGGVREPGSATPYDANTLQSVFSTTKGATAACACLLVQRGQLDLQAPVARYWPEFAAEGKERIPVRWLLDHRAGLIDVDRQLTLEQTLAWDPVIDALAAQKPLWEPGEGHGYHATTYGWLVGEVIRRVSGKSVGRFFQDEIAKPLGLDFWIGLPREQHPRVADLIPESGGATLASGELTTRGEFQHTLLGRALLAPSGVFVGSDIWNDPRVRGAEIPAANGVTDAASLARMYAALVGEVDGVRLLAPEQLAAAATSENEGTDKCLMFESRFGIGFMKMSSISRGFGDQAIGHYGAGGSVGIGDPRIRFGFGYVMNQMKGGLIGDERSLGLIRAARRACKAKLGIQRVPATHM